MTMPSAYKGDLEKGQIVEDRDQVKVEFGGGNIFYIHPEGVDAKETHRGAAKAYERAEAIRKELNSDYEAPKAEGGETAAPPKEKSSGAVKKKSPKSKKAKKAKKAGKAVGKAMESGQSRAIMFSGVDALLSMVPVNEVLDLLADQAGRVSLLQGSSEARRLARRVRATEGRCAPIFLTKLDINDEKEAPKLFDGLLTLAAALNLDMERIAVVTLPSGDAYSLQAHCVAMMNASLSREEDFGEDDQLRARVQNEE